jgi:ATP adenylyltransferase
MTVPYAHLPSLEDLDPATRAELLELAVAAMQVIQTLYRPQGYNLGINLGESAGAGILDHVHMHVVPRWSGDTNFMSTLGSTRVLPETLEDTYIKMKKGWR